jgi:murein DD-endopeptidase MepM/ murein hydrolase activator NlpD
VVLRPFVAPPTRFGPGHRGVDLAASAGQPVLAVDAGTVTHAGVVAGRGTVTVAHRSGLRSTYEPVRPAVVVGTAVAAGAVLGVLEGTGGTGRAEAVDHCGRRPCLHLGAVRGTAYVDPLALLERRRVVLLPLAGGRERPRRLPPAVGGWALRW